MGELVCSYSVSSTSENQYVNDICGFKFFIYLFIYLFFITIIFFC